MLREAWLEIVVDRYRSVVGEAFVAVNRRGAHARREIGRDELVVDAPTEIPLERVAPILPPGKLFRLMVDRAKRVDPADAFDDVVEPAPLVGQKPGRARAGFGIEDVDVAVRDIVVAAHD